MKEKNFLPAGHSGEPSCDNKSERKAFIFYTNWYTDVSSSLSEEQQGEFLITIVRYASEGTLPDESTTPVVAAMFNLIKNVIDSDLEKYKKIVELNNKRAKAHRKKNATTDRHICADTQHTTHRNPILNTQDSTLNTPHSTSSVLDSEEEKKEEADVIFEARKTYMTTEAPVTEDEAKAYWAQHGLKSDCREFLAFYARNDWRKRNGESIRSWKKAAWQWEQKFIHDVLPARRREALAEERVAREEQRLENRRIHTEDNRRHAIELEQQATKAVSREMARYMHQQALALCHGNQQQAIDMLRQASTDATLFQLLSRGFEKE